MCFLCVVFREKTVFREQNLKRRPDMPETKLSRLCHGFFRFYGVSGGEAFKYGVTGYCAARHLFTPPPPPPPVDSAHRLPLLSVIFF